MASAPTEPLNVTENLTGKRVLFAGATGFVGKVSLSMLLHRFGDVLERVYVVVRKGSARDAVTRFYDKVATSEPFEPLRERHGDGLRAWLEQKCTVLDGDITDPWLGLDEAFAKSLRGAVDVVVNCAGLVSFNPSLEVGLNVNTRGVQHLVQACVAWDAPLVHMSTAFVAGNRSGLVFEDDEVRGYFPRRGEVDGRDFSLEQELADCEKLIARWREMADDKALASEFRTRAIERLEAEGRDPGDEKALRLATGRERKLWLSGKLVDAGMERARHWGWPNTYTYTKSLGEQVIAQTPGLRYALVRPSIVESAARYPFPGWNEGFTTSAPIIYACMKGQGALPLSEEAVLDLIPVDMVAGSLIAIIAEHVRSGVSRVYQQASGDSNPFIATRAVELVGLHRRRYLRRKTTGNALVNELRSKLEPQSISKRAFELRSSPLVARGSRWLAERIEANGPSWGAPRVTGILEKARGKLIDVAGQADSINTIVTLFLPFIWDNRFVFRCDNTRALYARMPAADREKIPWEPEGLDWRSYFLDVHIPGLEKWVFPGLDEATERRRTVHTHRDLLELFDASVHAWRHRVAFRMYADERETRLRFGEVHHYAARVGSHLLGQGVKHGDRVVLMSENRPEWGTAFFGVLRAGATVVPVDRELGLPELLNIARRAKPSAYLLSDAVAERLPELPEALEREGLPGRVVRLGCAMAGDERVPGGVVPLKRSASPDDVASLIFTSGTTGTPKGVMLTHRNFAALVAKLAGTFDIGVGDGVLSVLPLHHTFEFSAGFLTPFSCGAEISYVDELTGDRLADVMSEGNITSMVGVPAVWQLFHRKLTQELAAKPKFVEESVKALMAANAELRNAKGLNLGKLLFWPVHRRFGGRIRFLISGGSALHDDVHKAFHALGFDLNEGYGLTEAAPVLTVAKAGERRQVGTVGRALPGIELRIDAPEADGVGEVVARGPNVMAGYFGDREATEAVLKGGWLHTGDLGRLDAEGNLYLIGRKKDVIIDTNGRNVYPDELEELYGGHPHLKELSIVGLPDDAGGERVACLAVPDYKDRARDEVRHELEEHFRAVSHDLPFYRRVRILRLWDGELPRTSTRKIRRPLVVEELKRLERLVATAERGKAGASSGASGGGTGAAAAGDEIDWLRQLVADVAQRPVEDVRPSVSLAGELGFDSLMFSELAAALEQAGVAVGAGVDLSKLQTLDELRRAVLPSGGRRAEGGGHASAPPRSAERTATELELPLPDSVARAGSALVSAGQAAVYRKLFDVKVTGEAFLPRNRNFLVVSNHASHLDMGLVRQALGEQGRRLVALAARDYFFDTAVKRAYFENFTDLIPMERQGSLRESLRLASEALAQGYNLLLFPEGTRSATGELREFKPTTGFLALGAGVDIVPVYLRGTFEALPRGSWWPKRVALEVNIGPTLEAAELSRRAQGLPRSDQYRVVTGLAEQAVRALAERRGYRPEALAVPPRASRPHRRGAQGS